MYFLYDLFLLILIIILLPFFLIKLLKGKYREGLIQRFGFLPADIRKRLEGKKIIWVHAVSVGETVAASPLVKELKRQYPGHTILFSTVTDTGQEMARKIVEEADVYIYFPLDFSFIVRKVLNIVKPELIIIMETELWPNFIRLANQKGIKIVYANGRISDRSFRTYRYLGPYLKDMLKRINLFCMQSEQDVLRIISLGADEEKVYNTGNTKLDQDYTELSPEVRDNYLREFKVQEGDKIMVIGSTHDNEEEQFIDIYQELKEEFKDLLMILAPRHIERIPEIEEKYQKAGINTIRRTEIEKRKEESVILLDTIGELGKIYSLADLVFVGGSLVEFGGHNILEPAAHGKLVFFGPHMFDFKESTRILLDNKAAIQVKDKEELIEKMRFFLSDLSLAEKYANKARTVLEKNQGATYRIINLLKKAQNWRCWNLSDNKFGK